MDIRTAVIVGAFRKYIKQRVMISADCTKFTKITQENVDNGDTLEYVFGEFDKWLKSYGSHPYPNKNSAFVTWTDADLKIILPRNCQIQHITKPSYFGEWIDLSKNPPKLE